MANIQSIISMMIIATVGSFMMCGIVRGQGPEAAAGPELAPAPAVEDCITPLLNLSDCLTYVESGSNVTKPSKGCCPGLEGLIGSSPKCLCQLLADPNITSSFGVQVDPSKALKLPTICKIDTPVSLCALLGVPVGAPTTGGGSTAASSPTAPPPEKSRGGSRFSISALAIVFSLSGVAAAIF
ncbi:non-specific lipid transfer protein GPI-anchored 2-like [Magnolia sinica]|uniref:non-specific lipid transfer protein GPI-anchored 2-like n=1 Tax=Magnolia sinica TaxID=86752 RepID=UPI00265B186E|nr:non-specific lipid transfer protein GPI-anchored 2-like [Magnolia sinica]